VELSSDILIVGAGCGGVAAALSAARLGRRVILTEPTRWIGGQLTAQAVPPDEHPWMETTGATATYRQMREAVRERFRRQPGLSTRARGLARINPGDGWVSSLCAEPALIQSVLLDMLASYRASEQIRLLTNYAPSKVEVEGDVIKAVACSSTTGGAPVTIEAAYVLDATEEGDLLPLSGCEHVIGAESREDTGEPHALSGPPDPVDQQAITWCAAVEWCPGEDHTIVRPGDFGFWSSYRAPFWPGPQLGWTTQDPETGEPLSRPLFGLDSEKDLWRFRRIRRGDLYQPPVPDATVINWPQVDYWLAPVTGVPEELRRQRLAAARGLTLSFVHWLQREAPRPDGGVGYPGLRLSGDVIGTEDGLALSPYIRESRRIRAVFTVLEQHVGVDARRGMDGAETFADSIGVGSYRIDLHPSPAGRGYLDIATYPFQIPLGALIPLRMENLIGAGKCLGVTHITNGCYRVHPVEWNVGEAAGALAAYALQHRLAVRAIRAHEDLLDGYRMVLTQLGIQLAWPDAIRGQPR
jgi:hypothetical protein